MICGCTKKMTSSGVFANTNLFVATGDPTTFFAINGETGEFVSFFEIIFVFTEHNFVEQRRLSLLQT